MYIVGYTRQDWEVYGLGPFFIALLLDDGFDKELIDSQFSFYVGPDYAEHKVGWWIDRMKEAGFTFGDGVPVYGVIINMLAKCDSGRTT